MKLIKHFYFRYAVTAWFFDEAERQKVKTEQINEGDSLLLIFSNKILQSLIKHKLCV